MNPATWCCACEELNDGWNRFCQGCGAVRPPGADPAPPGPPPAVIVLAEDEQRELEILKLSEPGSPLGDLIGKAKRSAARHREDDQTRATVASAALEKPAVG